MIEIQIWLSYIYILPKLFCSIVYHSAEMRGASREINCACVQRNGCIELTSNESGVHTDQRVEHLLQRCMSLDIQTASPHKDFQQITGVEFVP